MVRLSLAICGSLVVATTLCAQTDGPLRALPDGWLQLTSRAVDSWTGVYHDRVSGAYLTFRIGGAQETSFWQQSRFSRAEDKSTKGKIGTLPYELLELPDARSRVTQSLMATTGLQPQEFGSEARGILPPEGSTLHVVSFRPDAEGRWWNFSAATTSEAQKKRVLDLLLSGAEFNLAGQQRVPGRVNLRETAEFCI